MEALINISENNGQKLVSARELYENLGYDTSNYKRWYEKNIVKNRFAIENQDYSLLVIKTIISTIGLLV
jgi:phage anti-repressor protein